jgi:catalase (peroxidase I)
MQKFANHSQEQKWNRGEQFLNLSHRVPVRVWLMSLSLPAMWVLFVNDFMAAWSKVMNADRFDSSS